MQPSRLEPIANADMMSDMKTFTVRDLDRTPAKVLASCDADGEARIRCRDGRTYLIKPEPSPEKPIIRLPDFRGRLNQLFPKPLPAAFFEELDRMIGGE
jgi:hypothetical protein